MRNILVCESLLFLDDKVRNQLTRAPLGYFYNAPHWAIFRAPPPPLISKTTGPILKIQAAFESHGKTAAEGNQILLTSGSRVTSQADMFIAPGAFIFK